MSLKCLGKDKILVSVFYTSKIYALIASVIIKTKY